MSPAGRDVEEDGGRPINRHGERQDGLGRAVIPHQRVWDDMAQISYAPCHVGATQVAREAIQILTPQRKADGEGVLEREGVQDAQGNQ